MRKVHSPHGNVGPNNREDVHRRCNVCDFLAGVDGKRLMHKDEQDPLGGYICEKCKRNPFGHVPLTEEKDGPGWLQEAKYNKQYHVDGDSYDESIDDLIEQLERDNEYKGQFENND